MLVIGTIGAYSITAERGGTNASIVHENIEALFLCSEQLHCRLDGSKVGQVQREKLDAALATPRRLSHARYGFLGFGLGAACDPDGRIVSVENLAELEAHAGIATGHKKYLR